MDRAERRRCKRAGINPTEVAYIKQEITREACEVAYKSLFAVVGMYMHDKYGWGTQRISKMMEYVNTQFDAINEGYLTVDDVLKVLKDEVDITIVNGD